MDLVRILLDIICFLVPFGLGFLFMINRQKSKAGNCAFFLFMSCAVIFVSFLFNDLRWMVFSLFFNLLYPLALALLPVLYLLFLHFLSVNDNKMNSLWYLTFLFPLTAFCLYNYAFYFHYPFREIRDHFYELIGEAVIPERYGVISTARWILLRMETAGLVCVMAGQLVFVKFLMLRRFRKRKLDRLLQVIAIASCLTSGSILSTYEPGWFLFMRAFWIAGMLLLGVRMYQLTGTLSVAATPADFARTLKKEDLIVYFEAEKPWLDPELRLPEVIRALNTNRQYLFKLLKRDLHMNYADFVNSYRIKYAKQLICESGDQLKMSRISEMCGFKHYATFSEVFHKMTGQTPTEYFQMKKMRRTG